MALARAVATPGPHMGNETPATLSLAAEPGTWRKVWGGFRRRRTRRSPHHRPLAGEYLTNLS